MSDLDGLKQRVREVVEAARAADVLPELDAFWKAELRPRVQSADAGSEPIPMRFGIVAGSAAMEPIFELIEKVAPANVAVLVQGETGTGKELVARALHENSPRRKHPLLAENCAAVPANLLESELFGHKKGAFTGAVADRPGHFVAADGGTLFLDEIGDMPLEMQAKLLRVLQDGEVRPVGATKSTRVDVRVIAATNKDLQAMCAEGTFREDLFFRLNVINIKLPPLREREGDVERLTRFFLNKIGAELGRETTIQPEAVAALAAWRWPGNVRELENELQRAVALSSGEITLEGLSPAVRQGV